MGFENFISESEAASLAGVSVATLIRFAEAGYLEVETESDGLRLFSSRELAEVFGISPERIEKIQEEKPSKQQEDVSFAATAESSLELSQPRESLENDSGSAAVEPFVPEFVSKGESTNRVDPRTPLPDSRASLVVELEERVRALQTSLALQEKLLDSQDAQIRELGRERDWLRERIERFEQKGERDQLLLLSETQVLRQLITQQQRRSTPLRNALEWIGLLPAPKAPQITNGGTYEVNSGS